MQIQRKINLIQPIFRASGKLLLEMQESSDGFKLFMFEAENPQTSMQASEINVESLDQIKGLNKYFDTVEDVKDYIKLKQNLKVQAGKIEINTKHPVLKQQLLKMGTLDLQKKEKLSRQDYDYINRLCMSDKPLESNDLKSILLRVSQQLEYLSPLREKQVMQVRSPFAEFHLEKKEEETVERQKQSELEILRGVFQKKIQALAFELQKNRQIMFDKFEKIEKLQIQGSRDADKNDLIQLQQWTKKQIGSIRRMIALADKNLEYQLQKVSKQYGLGPQMSIPQMGMPLMQMPQMMGRPVISFSNKFKKIEKIQPGEQKMNIIAKVMDVKQLSKNKVLVILGDQTGIVNGLFQKNNLIKQNASIQIQGCWAKVFKQHIQIQLQRNGQIKPLPNINMKINKQLNMSQKPWVELI